MAESVFAKIQEEVWGKPGWFMVALVALGVTLLQYAAWAIIGVIVWHAPLVPEGPPGESHAAWGSMLVVLFGLNATILTWLDRVCRRTLLHDAETAKTAAETAKTAAETAKTAAETAKTAAEAAARQLDERVCWAESRMKEAERWLDVTHAKRIVSTIGFNGVSSTIENKP